MKVRKKHYASGRSVLLDFATGVRLRLFALNSKWVNGAAVSGGAVLKSLYDVFIRYQHFYRNLQDQHRIWSNLMRCHFRELKYLRATVLPERDPIFRRCTGGC